MALTGLVVPSFLAIATTLLAGTLTDRVGRHAALTGTQAAWFAELFRTNTRTSGASIGYQVAASIAGFARSSRCCSPPSSVGRGRPRSTSS